MKRCQNTRQTVSILKNLRTNKGSSSLVLGQKKNASIVEIKKSTATLSKSRNPSLIKSSSICAAKTDATQEYEVNKKSMP